MQPVASKINFFPCSILLDDVYMCSVSPQPFAAGHPSVSDNMAKEEDLAAKSKYFGISADNGTGCFHLLC